MTQAARRGREDTQAFMQPVRWKHVWELVVIPISALMDADINADCRR